nr:hypothetical protein [Tanacetum cinerariifolium]
MVDDGVGNQARHTAMQNDGNEIAQKEEARIQITQEEFEFMAAADAYKETERVKIAQKEEARIQITQDEFEFMAAADAYEETERVKVNCTLEDTLQQASTSGTKSDNAPIYDSDGSTEVPKDKNCYDHDIFNMLTHEVQYTDLQTELDRTKEKLKNCIIKKEKECDVLWNN